MPKYLGKWLWLGIVPCWISGCSIAYPNGGAAAHGAEALATANPLPRGMDNSSSPDHLTLSRAATVIDLNDSRFAASVSYPRLSDPHYTQVNGRIAAEARDTQKSQVAMLKGLVGHAAEEYSQSQTQCNLVGLTSEIVSIRCENSTSTGGPAYADVSTYNYGVAKDGSVRDLKLWDLLQLSPEGAKVLSGLILRDLQRQGASYSTDRELGEQLAAYVEKTQASKQRKQPTFTELLAKGRIDSFVVTSAGLAFYFEQYYVLPGCYDCPVILPYDQLASLIRRDGPLGLKGEKGSEKGERRIARIRGRA